MMVKGFKKKDKGDVTEKTFIAYIVKGNRQIIRRDINASKRFRVEDNTYIVKDDCIFYKNIDGHLKSVSYYRENNPKPYNFKEINKGFSSDEFDKIFGEDLDHIIKNINPENKTIYVLMLSIFSFAVNLVFAISLLIKVFIL